MLARYRAGRAVRVLLGEPDPESRAARSARATLREIGAPAVPVLLRALDRATDTRALEDLLLDLLDRATVPWMRGKLMNREMKAASAVARVLSRAERLDPEPFLDLLEDPEAPVALLMQVLESHRRRLSPASLLERVPGASARARSHLFRLLRQVARADQVPELVRRLGASEPQVRLEVVRTLAGFQEEAVRESLVSTLFEDTNKEVRLAALDGLLRQPGEPPVEELCRLLRDPDMLVRNQAIDALVRLDRPESVHHLVGLLDDESEDVRRAVVEVLNEVSTPAAVRGLLRVLGDDDWWVRVRAGDALARIGGPSVVEGILPLLLADDRGLREAALDILKRAHDERTFHFLVQMLGDERSAIRERAVDALAALDKKAPEAAPVLERRSDLSRAAIQALGHVGDARAIPALVSKLRNGDDKERRGVLEALERLARDSQAELVLSAVESLVDTSEDDDLRRLSLATVSRLSRRLEERRTTTPSPSGDRRVSPSDEVLDLSGAVPAAVGAIDPLSLSEGVVLAGRYRVVRQVGRGGFGVVVLVLDEMVRDEIILKFLGAHVASDPSAVERFKHELRYARRITHENVIRIYDIINFGRSLAISMEYFASHSLAWELKRRPVIPAGRGLGVIAQVCKGLAVAHRVRVVHRDLKPGNILLDERDRVKIVDFGLSAAASQGASRLTRSGLVIGTPTYMAPEQIRGRAVDARTDIYSLGILMYELFTGRPPYEGTDSMAILFQHLEGKAEPPRQINPELSEQLETIILHAINVDPEERYASAEELLAELEEVPEMGGA